MRREVPSERIPYRLRRSMDRQPMLSKCVVGGGGACVVVLGWAIGIDRIGIPVTSSMRPCFQVGFEKTSML